MKIPCYSNLKFSNTKPLFWFYKLNINKNINSSKEIKIANDMPLLMSKRFLETRSCIRKSLGELFNLNPIDVPLLADPGKPPIIQDDYGFLSISHTNDALIIVWDDNQIGIDMERKDREFNYKLIANKLIKNKNILEDLEKIERLNILNLWCGYESAIKWIRGSIFKDIYSWKFNDKDKTITHIPSKVKLNIKQFYFYDWTITFASRNNYLHPKICFYGFDHF